MDPRTGAVLAAAGVAFSGLQPPGSTMKIVTVSGLLGAGLVSLNDTFAIATEATIDGFALQNANGEACGGTLINSFAVSCNSVFAPLGVRLGASRFLSIAQRFGFNAPSPISGEPASTIPPSSVHSSDLELGASAIGQGKVQATALQMADVAATIAMGGQRPIPTLLAGAPPRFVAVTSRRVAHAVQEMMVAVVNSANGTGTLAQLPGVEVAGKTGTAELRNTTDTQNPNANSPANTDAWFVGYAPVGHPRIVVGALFPGQGAGGATAAPATRDGPAGRPQPAVVLSCPVAVRSPQLRCPQRGARGAGHPHGQQAPAGAGGEPQAGRRARDRQDAGGPRSAGLPSPGR